MHHPTSGQPKGSESQQTLLWTGLRRTGVGDLTADFIARPYIYIYLHKHIYIYIIVAGVQLLVD